MLDFQFLPEGRLPLRAPTAYPALLRTNGAFAIRVDGRIFFSEPSFPVYEFLAQANGWLAGGCAEDMEYASVETQDNPLIAFRKCTDGGFRLESPWAEEECAARFRR